MTASRGITRAPELPLHYNAVEILEANLASRADKPALLTDERTLTFGEVAREANRVGSALRAAGVRLGDPVAIAIHKMALAYRERGIFP